MFAQSYSGIIHKGPFFVVVIIIIPHGDGHISHGLISGVKRSVRLLVQGGWGGWPTGNGKKLSYSQACCLAQLCLAAA